MAKADLHGRCIWEQKEYKGLRRESHTTIRMHVPFDPQHVNWLDVQFGAGGFSVQTGYGHYNIFHGTPYQRGAGIGSIFRSVFRYLLPIAAPAGQAIGREALETGSRILNNLVKGDVPLKQAVVSEGRAGLKNLLDKASTSLAKRQQGQGRLLQYKKHIKGEQAKSRTLRSLVPPPSLATTTIAPSGRKKGKPKTRRVRVDSLGSY